LLLGIFVTAEAQRTKRELLRNGCSLLIVGTVLAIVKAGGVTL